MLLTLFAQAGRKGDADAAAAAGMSFFMVFIVIMLIAMAVGIAIQVFYCLTLSKALKECRPENRDLEPGQVWLQLIPIFNIYWNFVTTSKVPSSLKNEFRDRGMGKRGDDYGANIGKWYAICVIGSILPFVGGLIGLASLVLWIMFWVKIAGYSKQLREDSGGGGGDYDDEEDDRPRSKKRSRDEDDEDEEEERPRPKKKRRRDDDYDDE